MIFLLCILPLEQVYNCDVIELNTVALTSGHCLDQYIFRNLIDNEYKIVSYTVVKIRNQVSEEEKKKKNFDFQQKNGDKLQWCELGEIIGSIPEYNPKSKKYTLKLTNVKIEGKNRVFYKSIIIQSSVFYATITDYDVEIRERDSFPINKRPGL